MPDPMITVRAVENYRQSLELLPANANPAEQVKALDRSYLATSTCRTNELAID